MSILRKHTKRSMTIITNTTSMIAELHKLHSESKGQGENKIKYVNLRGKKDLSTKRKNKDQMRN